MTEKIRSNVRYELLCAGFSRLIKLFISGLLLCVTHIGYAQDVIKIQVNPKDLPAGECKLSDLAESIEYIPLETTDQCLIGQVGSFDISDNYIVVYCVKSESIYLFNRSGKFICKVGSKGQGPGEYLGITGLFIDEKRQRIIVQTINYQGILLSYDLKGKFIDAISYKENSVPRSYRRLYNDNYFIMTQNFHGEVPFAYEIRDMNLKLIAERIKTVAFDIFSSTNDGAVAGRSSHYLYNGKIHTREAALNDTIYSIEHDYSFKPKYVVDAGRYEVTTDLLSDINGFLGRVFNYVRFFGFFETKDKLLIHYSYGSERNSYGELISSYCYHDNATRKLLYFKSEKGIPNDFDGGLDFWPERQDNRTWYAFYDAYIFEKELSTKKKETPKGDARSVQSFNKLMQTLDPDDNPVLMIVKIKE